MTETTGARAPSMTMAPEKVEELQQNGVGFSHVPTALERMWRGLGYRYHLGDEPEGCEKMEGWMCTVTNLRFSLRDRLRLLLTGRLHINLVQHLPVKCDFAKNRLDWQIKAPGEH